MDKLKFETPDMVAGNIEKIGALFPAAITEMRGEDGQIKKGINFEVLKQLLSRDVVDGDECYEFTWVGKKAAMAEAARPTTRTLRPVKEDSRDWDTTQNLYIEGDNLEVLKILQESYLGKVKMIYIDPPYNTGHDFIYRDKFQHSQQEENEQMGMYDEDENQMFENTESNGRFHSDWCSMLYSRLIIAKDFLSDDGAIFVSIDENELSNLINMMNEVFGRENFIDAIVWDKKASAKGVPPRNMMVNVHEYIVAYQRNGNFKFMGEKRSAEADGFKNPDNDPRGPWRESNIKSTTKAPEEAFTIVDPNTGKAYTNTWAFSKESLERMIREGRILWKDSLPKQKEYMLEMSNENKAIKSDWGVFDAQSTTVFLKNLIPEVHFDNPKPINLMKYLISVTSSQDCIILDFFSGSATTAHAVMQLNAEDGGNRKFILVQLPESCDEKSDAYKAGFKTICEIGKERIRRVGNKIKEDSSGTRLDVGFRVFRIDESNMKDVYYHPTELEQQSLLDMVSNIKDDRTDMDLLYACLLDWGVEIHLPHTSTDLDGCTVHDVDNGALMACFSPNVPRSVVEYMAKQQPLRAVFRDSAFASDDAKINVTEIFKSLSPDTKVKVI